MKAYLSSFGLLGALVVLTACPSDTKYAYDCSTGTASTVHISQPSYNNCTPEEIAKYEKADDDEWKRIDGIYSGDPYAKEGPVSRVETPGSGTIPGDSAGDSYLRSESSSVH